MSLPVHDNFGQRSIFRDAWPSSGYSHLTVSDTGRLKISSAFLRYLFERPELMPIETSCAKERALHRVLLEDPGRPVGELELQSISDADTRENYRVALGFRNFLLQQDSIESAYLALVSGKAGQMTPPILIEQLVQIILSHLLAQERNPYRLRAAEIFFRLQKVSLDGGILLADAEVLEKHRGAGGATILQRLIQQAQETPEAPQNTLAVLTQDDAEQYWQQTEPFHFAFCLHQQEPSIEALCHVLESWIAHFHGLSARIHWVSQIPAERWFWHIGLDVESTRILNALYRGEAVGETDLQRILVLLQLELEDHERLRPDMAGRPIFLGIAMTRDNLVRFKPQNVLLNLPLMTSV